MDVAAAIATIATLVQQGASVQLGKVFIDEVMGRLKSGEPEASDAVAALPATAAVEDIIRAVIAGVTVQGGTGLHAVGGAGAPGAIGIGGAGGAGITAHGGSVTVGPNYCPKCHFPLR